MRSGEGGPLNNIFYDTNSNGQRVELGWSQGDEFFKFGPYPILWHSDKKESSHFLGFGGQAPLVRGLD